MNYNMTTQGGLVSDLYKLLPDPKNKTQAFRVSVSCVNVTDKKPFVVTVVQGKSILTIALPRIQPHRNQNFPYWFSSDTICSEDFSSEQLSEPIFVSVASSVPATFDLKVKEVDNFFIRHEPIKIRATPPEPRLHIYTFPDNVDKVFLKATSDSNVCARLMARKANCPAFDTVGLAEFSDVCFYQSFTTFGGFYVKKKEIGSTFHIIFSVSPDDSICGTDANLPANPARIKKATITMTPIPDEYMLAALPLIIYFSSIVLVFIFTYCHSRWLDKQENNEPNIPEGPETVGTVLTNKTWLFDKPTRIVSHKEYEKQRLVKESKYFNFLYFQIFGALLPAFTTLFANQKRTFKKTHLDTCYFNFLCSLEFLNFRAFNNMASASSLIIIGIVQLIIVFRKSIFKTEVLKMPTTHGIQKRDAPKVVCILSIVALGILWTVTRNCPHQTTNHLYVYTFIWLFLSAFMWIYSKRHGVRKWQQLYIVVVSSVFGFFALVENMINITDMVYIILKIFFMIAANLAIWVFCFKDPPGSKALNG